MLTNDFLKQTTVTYSGDSLAGAMARECLKLREDNRLLERLFLGMRSPGFFWDGDAKLSQANKTWYAYFRDNNIGGYTSPLDALRAIEAIEIAALKST